MGEINNELMKNTRGEQFEKIFSNMINERCFDMINNNFGLGIELHINFARLCLGFLAIMKNVTISSLMEYYLNEMICRFDWAADSEIINEFSMEILESKIVAPQKKAIILLSSESVLVDKFSNCLNYLLKNPFKSPELHDDSKLILEALKIRPSLSMIFEGFLELIYKKTQHPRVFFIGNSILKNQRKIPLISIPKNEMKEKIDILNRTIHNKWITHQYKCFHMFVTSTANMMSNISSRRGDVGSLQYDEFFSVCLNYVTHFIFGSDPTKDLNFCKDSLLVFLQDLMECKEFTEDQFKFYLNGEEEKLQSFPFNFIVHIYLCAVFTRNDSKHFSYNNVMDLAFSIMQPTLENDQYIEMILIFIQWLEQIIEISGHDTFSLRQLIVILTYLRVMSHMNDKVNQTDDFELKGHFSMLLSRFKFKYFDNIQQSNMLSNENFMYSQNPTNNEAKQSLINLIASTFENLYNA
ncbi:predicted protein [Naegleria gruberi]|uniref:Predicted protein n=1 Tax=Naegleria gruberi TaxID=5762 RepID=D2V0Y6_NAEGR|nr:uncharacterized protein NAEGRDRAFT_62460 [Naegleria gruberi]EFC49598.1 predicted protein [Naegleria gruberi]|eukprot:XP_002682342.1 predicted protein [Naegleria gruberi strain NEG-M]